MLNLKYLEDTVLYPVSFFKISKNVVQVLGDIPVEEKGFILTRIDNPEKVIGDYSAYTTIYRKIDGGVQFSNDGSEYIEPVPVINFYSNGGGKLDGAVMQEAKNYEDLIIPTPIANENYVFNEWSPEIPESGKIEGDKTFTAIFESTLPEPEPEPTLEERVTVLEKDVQSINDTIVGGVKNE